MITFTFDGSGLKPPTAEELAKADAESTILVYITGIVEDGRPYYAYIAVKPSLYDQFKAKCDAKAEIIPGKYGAVIATGFESSPPPEVISMMRDTYGFDEHCLDKLREGLISQYKVFLKNNEDACIGDIIAMLKKKQTSGG
jgi:hypothetical protein